MQKWWRKHWQTVIISLVAGGILVSLVQEAQRIWVSYPMQSPLFAPSGMWAIRFLIVSLAMTPIHTVFNWKLAHKIRKPTGLWAFVFAAIHAGTYIQGSEKINFLEPTFIIYGTVALVILTVLAATSFRWTMRVLGKLWKPLHRLVYVAGILVIVHSSIAIANSKRMYRGAKISHEELQFYLILLVIFYVIRIPLIKSMIRSISPFVRQKNKCKQRPAIA